LGAEAHQPEDPPYYEEDQGGNHASHPRRCLSWLLRATILYLHPSGHHFNIRAGSRGLSARKTVAAQRFWASLFQGQVVKRPRTAQKRSIALQRNSGAWSNPYLVRSRRARTRSSADQPPASRRLQ
jgi:hypothetical protein